MTDRTTAADPLNQPVHPYIPDRYPYTYAADYIRAHPHTVPAHILNQAGAGNVVTLIEQGTPWTALLSRADATRIRQAWAAAEGRADEDLACMLADEHMRVNGIQKP